ncbi:L,D-transpeptidase [Bacillus sp. RO3]|nr:L,D-transpeptidase [Bacillus sp. RO3]
MNQFESHLKKNLERLNQNIYVSKDDPLYYEKILRYKDPASSEAHFHVAKKAEEEGALVKAYLHYKKAARADSPYYFKAKRSSKLLEGKITPPPLPPASHSNQRSFPAKSIMSLLILFNLLLMALFIWKGDTIRTIASTIRDWDTGKNVVYESEDMPYVYYFPEDMKLRDVEEALYDKAIQMGDGLSNKTLVLYGVKTRDPSLSMELLPLKSEGIKEQAFVIAKFNSAVDPSVNIRFLKAHQAVDDPYAYTYVATNLLRTALQSYIEEKGTAPPTLADLADDYPDNYLSFIPRELYLGSNEVFGSHSGQGGWVYNRHGTTLTEMVYPNIAENRSDSSPHFPYTPVEIIVDTYSYTLMATSAPYSIGLHPIGVGKDDSTPLGNFTVLNRVKDPRGVRPDMFGAAGLGMGDYAIHGTYDEQSIGREQSKGCIRMSNEDVQDLFHHVPKGATVTIVDNPLSMTGYSILDEMEVLAPVKHPDRKQTTERIFGWAG